MAFRLLTRNRVPRQAVMMRWNRFWGQFTPNRTTSERKGKIVLDEKVRAFLEEKRFAVLATIKRDGSPQQTVMWYELQGDQIMMCLASPTRASG